MKISTFGDPVKDSHAILVEVGYVEELLMDLEKRLNGDTDSVRNILMARLSLQNIKDNAKEIYDGTGEHS